MKSRTALAFAAWLCATPCVAAEPPGLRAAALSALRTYPSAGVGVAVIRHGKVVSEGYFGAQAPGVPVTARTMFNTASIMKTVTAETILRMADAHVLSLDEPIASLYVDPDLAADPRYRLLTPRLILSHQTGLLNWRENYPDNKLAFVSDPGTKFSYSGAAYVMLAQFASRRAGKPFAELADQYVFAPLGLKHAALGARRAPVGLAATPMTMAGAWKPLSDKDTPFEMGPNAADNLFISVDDYAKFMTSVLAPHDLSAALQADRQHILVSTVEQEPCRIADRTLCPTAAGHGLGWSIHEHGGRKILYHGGADWGENAIAFYEPASGDGMVVFVDGGNGMGVWLEVIDRLDPSNPLAAFARALVGDYLEARRKAQ